MRTSILTRHFSTEPYWTDGLAPFAAPAAAPASSIDVAIIGGGFAGLSAALTLARAGASVTVFEAGAIGEGAAARGAGSLSHVPKARLDALTALYGRDTALAVYREAREAREYVEALIGEIGIACGLRSSARFIAAHSPRAFARQREALDGLRQSWGEVELVERADQRREIGSDAFFGGIKLQNSATLQPALLQRGLATAAVGAGATLFQNLRVNEVRQTGRGFEIATRQGVVRSDHVILATNADTCFAPPRFRALARRLIRVPAYALATEELPADRVDRVLPIGGPISDTYKIIHYMAPSEDGRRLIISARAGRSDGDLGTKAHRMLAYFAARFPDLAGVRVSHCWTGFFAVTADWMPHIGAEDGVHYVLGCCGTGIPMSTYLGRRVAEKILGRNGRVSVFDRPLPPLPYGGAGGLLLPVAVRAYAIRDRLFN